MTATLFKPIHALFMQGGRWGCLLSSLTSFPLYTCRNCTYQSYYHPCRYSSGFHLWYNKLTAHHKNNANAGMAAKNTWMRVRFYLKVQSVRFSSVPVSYKLMCWWGTKLKWLNTWKLINRKLGLTSVIPVDWLKRKKGSYHKINESKNI